MENMGKGIKDRDDRENVSEAKIKDILNTFPPKKRPQATNSRKLYETCRPIKRKLCSGTLYY